MSGFCMVIGLCHCCGQPFCFNPHKVPSIRVNGARGHGADQHPTRCLRADPGGGAMNTREACAVWRCLLLDTSAGEIISRRNEAGEIMMTFWDQRGQTYRHIYSVKDFYDWTIWAEDEDTVRRQVGGYAPDQNSLFAAYKEQQKQEDIA